MRYILIFLFFLMLNSLFGQRTEVRLKRIEQGPKTGAMIIAGSDSFAIWSDSILFVNELLITPTDTFATQNWVRANTIIGEQLSQDLFILNDTLYIPGDPTPEYLGRYLDNTDSQSLSVTIDSLKILAGAGVSADEVIEKWNLLDTTYLDSVAYWNKNETGLYTNEKVGFGIDQPTESIDIDGQIRIRGLQVDNTINNIVGADLNNVLRKRSLSDMFDGVTIVGDGVVEKFAVDTSLLGEGQTQTLSINGSDLSISGGNTIGLPLAPVDEVIGGDGISIAQTTGSVTVDLGIDELGTLFSFDGNETIAGVTSGGIHGSNTVNQILLNTFTSLDGSVQFTNNSNTIDLSVSGGGSQLTQEEVQDYVGSMVSGNTESGISVTYDDANNEFDFVASDISPTNEIQDFDIAQLSGTDLQLSLTQDATTHSIDLSSLSGGGSYTSWSVRGDNAGLQSVTNSYILDVDGGNGIETRVSGGDLDILLNGSQLLTGFGIDGSHELWVFDGALTNQRYTVQDIVSEVLTTPTASSSKLELTNSGNNIEIDNNIRLLSTSGTTNGDGLITFSNPFGNLNVAIFYDLGITQDNPLQLYTTAISTNTITAQLIDITTGLSKNNFFISFDYTVMKK